MSGIVKVYRTLRNNWKKTVFLTGLVSYGSYWAYGKRLEFNLMKAYSEEAVKYGQQKLAPYHQARHVTVILNPVANKKNSKDDYEKYCAPLFNLAGLKVSLVTTEAEGQAKDLMEIMENTDCVVVAGGDGTVHEVITGLLRRKDVNTATKRFPIGIVPVGKHNNVAFKLNSNNFTVNDMKAKILGESSMAVIREVLNDVDVMKVEGEQGRPVYTLGQLNVGQIRNTIGKLDEYWYLGQKMKPYLTFFFQSFRDLTNYWDDKKSVEILYTKPCSGCSKCYQRFGDLPQLDTNADANQSSKRWWHMFLPRNRPLNQTPDLKALELERMKTVVNEDCDQLQSLTVNSKNILIRNRTDRSELELIIHPSDLKQSLFIKEGIRICKNKEFEGKEEPPFQSMVAKDYRIKMPVMEVIKSEAAISKEITTQHENTTKGELIEDATGSFSLDTNLSDTLMTTTSIRELDQEVTEVTNEIASEIDTQIEIQDNESALAESNQWLSIDDENYEYTSLLRVSLLPRKVQIYHNRVDTI